MILNTSILLDGVFLIEFLLLSFEINFPVSNSLIWPSKSFDDFFGGTQMQNL